MNTNNPIAVIFDMDGVLVDNAYYHQKAFSDYFKSYGIELSPNMFGRGNDELMKELFPNETSKEKLDEHASGKEAYYRQLYAPDIEPVAGLIAFLEQLKAQGVPMAVGSSAPTENIDFTLDAINIRHYFDTIVGSAMVKHAKPAPDIYLKAAELLNVDPARCIVFEDALAGVASARSAGMKVVGVATSLSAEELAHTDCVVKDFTTVDVGQLRMLVG